MPLLSGLMGALDRFSVPFYGWLLAVLGPVGLSRFCGALVPGVSEGQWAPGSG